MFNEIEQIVYHLLSKEWWSCLTKLDVPNSANSNGLEVGGFHIRVDITGKDIEVW